MLILMFRCIQTVLHQYSILYDTDDGDDSVTFGGFFNVKDSGGTIRKVPYLAT